MKNTYYQDELQYLREVGPEFARVNPQIARLLADRGADPDVERLLEGVAFLCGRIRQKLDDELPEFTASLMSLLWPHYLRPIPSLTILELMPELEGMQAPLRVPKGSEFASIPVDGTRCRYRSAWDVTVRPWTLKDVVLETASAKPVRLVLKLESAQKVQLEDLDLGVVRFHLSGEPRNAFILFHLLLGHLDHVSVSDGSSRHDRAEEILPAASVTASGLDRTDAVLPYPSHSFAGYRLLQEYFAFKDRFLFFDVKGLNRVVTRIGLKQMMEVAFTFNHRPDALPLMSRDNVRLHCAPIINLFDHAADPIKLKNDRVDYLMQPSKSGVADRRHAEIFAVNRVYGLKLSAGMESREFKPFYSFNHLATNDPLSATYYQTRREMDVLTGDPRRGTDLYISFAGGGRAGELPTDETISMELTCTNRELPSALRAGDIREPTDSTPAGIKFRNIRKPSATIPPPLGKEMHWRLISHMSLNYVSLVNAEHFKELLRVYDFQAEFDAQAAMAHQRMLDGIVSLRSQYKERMVRGAPIRGVQVDLHLNEDHFAGEGDAYLFATILDRFLGLYVTLNSFSQLNLRLTRSGLQYEFAPRWGEQVSPAEGR